MLAYCIHSTGRDVNLPTSENMHASICLSTTAIINKVSCLNKRVLLAGRTWNKMEMLGV